MRTDRKLSVYESIIENVKRDISLGILSAGEKLPSCREMAMSLGINPNTVQRAYSELEAQGVIYTIPKKGVFIGGNGGVSPLANILNAERLVRPEHSSSGTSPIADILSAQPLDQPKLYSNIKATIETLKQAGVTREQLIEIIDEVYKDD